MAIRYRREGLRIIREERAVAVPGQAVGASPLPMREGWTAAPSVPTRHQRIMAVVTPRQPVPPRGARGARGPVRVTGAQLLRARQLQGIGQRDLALHLTCARSSIAEAERGRRPVLPNVEQWVEAVLRAHGEWDAPEGGTTS